MRIFLFPFGLVYGVINRLRRRFYELGFFRAERLSKPVISIGNLTVGGTGKSPFVDVLLTQLEARGLKCCVLTRGYGRSSEKTLLVNESSTVGDAGDEPVWLFRRHPNAKIAVSADRVAGAKLAGDVDVFILDDGLQHLQIHRDFEITLIDATRPFSHYHPLPWGFGREGFQVLKNSDLVVLTRSNQAEVKHLDEIADVIFKNGVFDLAEADVEMDKIYDLQTGETKNGGAGGGTGVAKVALVSAVGNPESFEKLAKASGLEIVFHEKKSDHATFSAAELTALEKKAAASGAQGLLVTEKDSVKIQKILSGSHSLPWLVLAIKLTFDPALPDVYDLVSHSSR